MLLIGKKEMKVIVLWRFGGSWVLASSLLIATAILGAQCSAGQFNLVHLQRPRLALLQPHLLSSLHAFDASGRIDQVGIQPSEDICHPQSSPYGSSWIVRSVRPQTWNSALLTCWYRAAWAGGIFSMLLIPWENMDGGAWLTSWWDLVRLYIITTKRSRTRNCCSARIVCRNRITRKTSVASLYKMLEMRSSYPFQQNRTLYRIQ